MGQKLSNADFSLLPPHIITHILGYLRGDDFKNASSICKSWNYASTDPRITGTLILQPRDEHFPEIIKTNRRYGVLSLKFLRFDKVDSHYFNVFEKLCPYVHELRIIDCDLKIHHLLKLLELTTSLKFISLYRCFGLLDFPALFPLDYDCEAKLRIDKNLSGVRNIKIVDFLNMSLIADIVRCAINLNTFTFTNNEFCKYYGDRCPYQKFFTIFDNANTGSLKHLNLKLNFCGYADDFITGFVKIKNLHLRSFRLAIPWDWEGMDYKRSLTRQFILKLQSLVEFGTDVLTQDRLSLICQHLVNLKNLDCQLDYCQAFSELGNLKQLEKLRCGFSRDYYGEYGLVNFIEIDQFFNCKFEYLRNFYFGEFITESNLNQLCLNHPNLIELELTRLLTRNLEIIFKHLTKLRILKICFGFARLLPEVRAGIEEVLLLDSKQECEYKISHLQELEIFYLDELVNGIHADDVRQMKKLRSTNLTTLFRNQTDMTDKIILSTMCCRGTPD